MEIKQIKKLIFTVPFFSKLEVDFGIEFHVAVNLFVHLYDYIMRELVSLIKLMFSNEIWLSKKKIWGYDVVDFVRICV